MALSYRLWAPTFRKKFCSEINMVVETLERRLLPTFDTIEEEARALSEEVWESAMSEQSLGDDDPSEIAEAAQSFGIDHYM